MALSYSGNVNTYKVWLQDEAGPIEVKAEHIKEEGSFLYFKAQSQAVVLCVPTAHVKSVRHDSLPDPAPRQTSGTI